MWGTAASAAAVPAQGRDAPDVAMVITGGTGRSMALRSGKTAFARLWQLLQPTYVGTERVSEEWDEGRHPPIRMTVVWGLTGVGGWPQTSRAPGGDVAVQRQDQLFVAEDGTPWVRSDLAPDVEDDDIRWHRAPRSAFERLDLARLVGGSAGEVVEVDDGTAAGGGWSGPVPEGAGWGLAGLAVGFATGAGGTLLIRRAAARQEAGPPREGPRQELIDLDL
ncbi:hypothetical protein IM697_39725 [Streptomyces ferrugineus]|uniref:Uncharacterized protein n=1 Tax=Streptomyces ferrugineus TaxID=1413221 RepID=A0A7M2SYV0_9ACTN|nr:hypothetical protein IM697_39725 [Streptomyces ferrugineus]